MTAGKPLTPAQQQFGNQNARGCTTSGRPRSVSLPPDQMIELGKEMIEWVVEHDPIHLSQWYCIEKGYTDREWDTMHVAPEFFPYYEQALKLVGYKYLLKESPIESNLKQRWQRVYFKDLAKQEDIDLDAAEARKARSLMSEAKILEEERLKVLAAVQRGKKEIK